MISKPDLISYFDNGIKSKHDLRIGTEHEKFFLNKNPLKPKTYFNDDGIDGLFKTLIQNDGRQRNCEIPSPILI